jgi:hypothetical protein
MITDNETDELIFDFLEGNLSADEEEAFLLLKDESELFSHQVRLWQNTYLKESLPSVEALEKKILIQPKGYTGNLSARFYAFVIILIISLPIVGEHGRKFEPINFNFHAVEQKTSAVDIVPDQMRQRSEFIVNSRSKTIRAIKPVKRNIAIVEKVDTIYRSAMLSEMKPEPLVRPQKFTLGNIEIIRTRIQNQVFIRKKWSKNEMRQIRKKKRLDDTTYDAREFLKGNVPYVVPLKSSNF